MEEKQKIHAGSNSEITTWPPDVGRPSAALHNKVAAVSGGRHHVVINHVARLYFQPLPPLVFSVFAPYCIFCRLLHQLPRAVFCFDEVPKYESEHKIDCHGRLHAHKYSKFDVPDQDSSKNNEH